MNFSLGNLTQHHMVFLPGVRLSQLYASPASYAITPDEDREVCKIPKAEISLIDDMDNLDLDDLEQPIFKSKPAKTDTPVHDDKDVVAINVNELIQQRSSPEPQIPVVFNDVPKFYYFKADQEFIASKSDIPKTTNLLCWSCMCQTDTFWQLPLSVERIAIDSEDPGESAELELDLSIKELAESDKFKHKRVKQIKAIKVEGIFCDVPCLGRYLTRPDVAGRVNLWQTRTLIKDMFKDRVGRTLRDIPISEDPVKMAKFCGPFGMTVSSYKDKNISILNTFIA